MLSGRVTESGVPVRDAAVTVTSGIGAGLSSTTDDNGRYTLFGVAGPVAIRVTKNGYATVSEPLTADAAGVLDFAITQLGVVDISGTYSMTLTADPACPAEGTQPGALPNELRQRQYVATITQAGATFRATLSGVPFVVSAGRGNGFSGRVEPGQVSFSIGDGYYTPYPDLIESLGPNGVFLVAGFGTIKRSGQDLLGELNGVFIVGQPPIWTNQWYVAECNRPHHRVVLTR